MEGVVVIIFGVLGFFFKFLHFAQNTSMINPVVSNIVVTIAKTKLILNMRFVHINPIKGYQSLPQHTVWQ